MTENKKIPEPCPASTAEGFAGYRTAGGFKIVNRRKKQQGLWV